MSKFRRNLAIIIGINHYQHSIPTLKTATQDAEKIAEILQEQHGYKIWGLLDEKATLAGCLRLLEEFLPKKIQESDRLIFYFAGHGIALNGDDGPEGFLIPQDAQLGDTNSYIPMVRLQKALSNLPCRHFLGILDCCFAGAFRWSSTRDLLIVPEVIHQEHYDRFVEAAAWQVITSASHDQEAFDSLALQDHRGIISGNHSPFAAALIEALQGEADSTPPGQDGKPSGDGVITATELYLYLRDRVEMATEGKGKRQTPGLYPLNKHDRGEYIFLTPEHELNLPAAPPLDESQNPYRGLESFDQEHSELFFGRQALTQKLYQFCQENPLTVVLGASGTGKSSLVKAGLITYLQQLETTDNRWQILSPMRPGESSFKALNKILTEHQSSGSSILSLTSLERKTVLSGKMEYLLSAHPQSKFLLVIDQTEELITLSQDQAEKDEFLALLGEWLEKYPQQLHIVLTLRSDFEPQFRNLVLKPYWQKARFIVPAMTREELREAIEKPASARVMYFEPYSLVDRLIDEVAQMPGALPLLSFALSELYLRYLQKFRLGIRDKRAITQEDYEEIGGVTQSLTQRADSEYENLVKQDPAFAPTIRYVMLRMIAVGGGELARRRVLLSELEYPEPENTRVKQIIRHFSAARLLVEGQDAEGKPYVEPAHDVLVRGWQKLLAWKQEEEESLILQRRLTPAAEEWKNLEREQKRSALLTKAVPVINWLDARLYNIENVFYVIIAQLLKLRRISNKQNLLIGKPEDFLWNTNPYLSVLKEKLNSSNYWFNRIEAEFVERSFKRKRINRRRLNILLTLFISILSLSTFLALRSEQKAKASERKAKASEQSVKKLSEQLLAFNEDVAKKQKKVDEKKRNITPEEADSTPEETDSILEDPDSTPGDLDSTPEDPDSTPEDDAENLDSLKKAEQELGKALEERERAEQELRKALITEPDSTPEEPDSTPEETDSTPEETDSTPEETDSTPGDPDSTPEETDSTPGDPDSTPGDPDSTPEETDSTPEETDSTPEETDSTPEETDSTPEDPDSTPEDPDSTPEDPDSTPEETDSTTEETDSTTEDSDISLDDSLKEVTNEGEQLDVTEIDSGEFLLNR